MEKLGDHLVTGYQQTNKQTRGRYKERFGDHLVAGYQQASNGMPAESRALHQYKKG